MAIVSLFRFIAGLGLVTVACGAGAATVDVTVHRIAARGGTLRVALCGQAEFLKNCALSQSGKAEAGKPAVFRFDAVPPGRYAVTVYHDANDNRKLDRNFFGIPEEGVGLSRDARGVMGPPAFDDAAFDVGETAVDIPVSMNY